jgi:hypothetical protein
VELSILPADSKGRINYADFETHIRENTRAIICTHASNLTGNVLDVQHIGSIAKAHGLLFIVDASQTAGIFPIDVQKMQADILCFTGHKGLLGPQGTGGLYVREGIDVRPLLSGGSGVQTYSRSHPPQMPTALEAGTLNGHGIAWLGASVRYILETGLENIRLSAGLTSLSSAMFEECGNLKSIIIPDGVTAIDSSVFRYCRSLSDVQIPSSVLTIGTNAFSECYGLTEIIIPYGVKKISRSFTGCSNLRTISIPDSVTDIGSYTFSECTSLTSIVLPSGLTVINSGVFECCLSLRDITIPASVVCIKSSAFYECRMMSHVYYEGSQEQWKAVTVETNNTALDSATIYFDFSAHP